MYTIHTHTHTVVVYIWPTKWADNPIVCPSETNTVFGTQVFLFIFFICFLTEFMQNITTQRNRIETAVVSADNRFQYYESIAFPCPNGRIKKNYNNQMLEDDFITAIIAAAAAQPSKYGDSDGYPSQQNIRKRWRRRRQRRRRWWF